MIASELLELINRIDPLLKDAPFPSRERLLSRTVKLNEEVGELCEAVLAEAGQQPRKDQVFDLEGEIADVIITTLLVAKQKNIDVNRALIAKIDILRERFKL